MTRAVVVVPEPLIGDAKIRVEDPFWLPDAVRITVPLLILPIGGWKRLALTLVLLLGIKLIVLLPLFVFTLLLLLMEPLVGIIETSLFNLWGCGGCCCSCCSRNCAACSRVSSPENIAVLQWLRALRQRSSFVFESYAASSSEGFSVVSVCVSACACTHG